MADRVRKPRYGPYLPALVETLKNPYAVETHTFWGQKDSETGSHLGTPRNLSTQFSDVYLPPIGKAVRN